MVNHKKIRVLFVFLIFTILLVSIISAEIIINQQPGELYNLGDVINLPLKIAPLNKVMGQFQMNLICNGIETEVYKADVNLLAGEELPLSPIIILEKSRIGESTGTCKIKATLGKDYALTDEFELSDLIMINLKEEIKEFTPEKKITIKGDAVRENGNQVDGFVELKLIKNNKTVIDVLDTVNSGFFQLNFSIPQNTAAGKYIQELRVYEKSESGEKTNNGIIEYDISIVQVPTSLEIFFENSEIEPGTELKVKAILHDQTGEKIKASSIITIKNAENEIQQQTEKATDQFLSFLIQSNEAPSEWSVVGISEGITGMSAFKIMEKQDITVELINRTLLIKNTGNVPYNKSVTINIGNESIKLDVTLDVDKSQKYVLSAPDGEYQISIISNGESKISGMSVLTGKAVDIKKISGVGSFVRHPAVWFFMIGILGFVAFILFKKGYKKSFIGYIHSKRIERKDKIIHIESKSFFNIQNRAHVSLSIKGEKQDISLICLKLKNLKEIESNLITKEAVQSVINTAENSKAAINESSDSLFILFVPMLTKTFDNEKTALTTAQEIKEIIDKSNKLSRVKINFGISVSYGAIIGKQEKGVLWFMSMGSLVTSAKKIASISDGEIYLSEKMKEKSIQNVKTEKIEKNKTKLYALKEIKNAEEHKKFIKSFLDRTERKK